MTIQDSQSHILTHQVYWQYDTIVRIYHDDIYEHTTSRNLDTVLLIF